MKKHKSNFPAEVLDLLADWDYICLQIKRASNKEIQFVPDTLPRYYVLHNDKELKLLGTIPTNNVENAKALCAKCGITYNPATIVIIKKNQEDIA